MDNWQRNHDDKAPAKHEATAKGDQHNRQTDEPRQTEVSGRHANSIHHTAIRPIGSDSAPEMPVVVMAWAAYEDILRRIASRPAETGGILLGPVGSAEITRFYFDQAGSCTACSYSPDYVGLSRRMKQEWLPSGIDMKGFVHSHPDRLDRLTVGDLNYVRRLLLANNDMTIFVAPIVIPEEFRIQPIVVLRTSMSTQRQARLALY